MPKTQTLIAELNAERAQLLAMIAGLDEDHADLIVYDNWRVQDILAHIASGEKASLVYIKMIVANKQMPAASDAPPFDLDRWNQAQVERRRNKSLMDIIMELHESRQATLAFVAGLNDETLEKRGSHPVFQDRTIAEVVRNIAEADHHHLQGISLVLQTIDEHDHDDDY